MSTLIRGDSLHSVQCACGAYVLCNSVELSGGRYSRGKAEMCGLTMSVLGLPLGLTQVRALRSLIQRLQFGLLTHLASERQAYQH